MGKPRAYGSLGSRHKLHSVLLDCHFMGVGAVLGVGMTALNPARVIASTLMFNCNWNGELHMKCVHDVCDFCLQQVRERA